MSEYTPTTEGVRGAYAAWENDSINEYGEAVSPEFDRWLAAHDEQVRAAERERCAQIAESLGGPEPSRRFSPEHWIEWRERMTVEVAAAIRAVPAEQKESNPDA